MPGVPGVVDVDGSGVKVSDISVGRDNPARVGGRVDVTKRGAAVLAVSCETLRQELRLKLMSRNIIQIFFIWGILLGKYYRVPHNLLNLRFEFQSASSPESLLAHVMRESGGKINVPKVSSERIAEPLKPSGRLT